jgi:cobalt/nickel transport system permease protein
LYGTITASDRHWQVVKRWFYPSFVNWLLNQSCKLLGATIFIFVLHSAAKFVAGIQALFNYFYRPESERVTIMHMADALLSPAVGGTMWAVSACAIAYCSKKVSTGMSDRIVPLMGVLGAFIFAAQMINFTIPVTGSSGHLGGGLLLSILLGPHAAFLTIASVLVVQALFFADGGLLALGCNIFNLGFFPAFIAYPFIYKVIIGREPTAAKISAGSMVAAIISLQLGSFSVVLETISSGISSLPFLTFVALIQPIQLVIGIVEGLITAAVISFVYKARPEIVQFATDSKTIGNFTIQRIILIFLAAAVVMGGFVSRFASKNPDELEWAITKITGNKELKGPDHGLHAALHTFQEKFAILPEYSFRKTADVKKTGIKSDASQLKVKIPEEPKNPVGTSVAGLVGGTLTLGLVFLVGVVLKKRAGIT